MLEELKMRGFGNGIVKKLMKGLESIKNIFSIIGKHIGAVIGGVIDMFAYTSLLIPLLNGVMAIIHKYDLNLETLPQNFLGLAVGVGTIIAKHGIVEIISILKSKFTISQKEVLDDIDRAEKQMVNSNDFEINIFLNISKLMHLLISRLMHF
jgi:hypothetical protein